LQKESFEAHLIVPEDNMLIDIDCERFQRATLNNEAERVCVQSSITGWRRIEWNLSTPKAATGAENPQELLSGWLCSSNPEPATR
jgi:hypothetical protein